MPTGRGVTFHVEGLTQLQRKLTRLHRVDIKLGIKEANRRSALLVARRAVPRVPVLSGRLARSVRTTHSQNSAAVLAGTKAIPYAEVIHWGWPEHNITGVAYVWDAAADSYDEVERFYEAAMRIATRSLSI